MAGPVKDFFVTSCASPHHARSDRPSVPQTLELRARTILAAVSLLLAADMCLRACCDTFASVKAMRVTCSEVNEVEASKVSFVSLPGSTIGRSET